IAQRQRKRRREDSPALAADELYREYVVCIPMLAERAVAREAQIRVAGRLRAGEPRDGEAQPLRGDGVLLEPVDLERRAALHVAVELRLVEPAPSPAALGELLDIGMLR